MKTYDVNMVVCERLEICVLLSMKRALKLIRKDCESALAVSPYQEFHNALIAALIRRRREFAAYAPAKIAKTHAKVRDAKAVLELALKDSKRLHVGAIPIAQCALCDAMAIIAEPLDDDIGLVGYAPLALYQMSAQIDRLLRTEVDDWRKKEKPFPEDWSVELVYPSPTVALAIGHSLPPMQPDRHPPGTLMLELQSLLVAHMLGSEEGEKLFGEKLREARRFRDERFEEEPDAIQAAVKAEESDVLPPLDSSDVSFNN